MDKDVIERMCRRAGTFPVRRERVGDYDIFIVDGFSAVPHVTYKKFDVAPGEFPFGCYVTIWWAGKGEGKIIGGGWKLYDAFHDPHFDIETKKCARINTALEDAADFRPLERANAH